MFKIVVVALFIIQRLDYPANDNIVSQLEQAQAVKRSLSRQLTKENDRLYLIKLLSTVQDSD
jgi:hypothetical protein